MCWESDDFVPSKENNALISIVHVIQSKLERKAEKVNVPHRLLNIEISMVIYMLQPENITFEFETKVTCLFEENNCSLEEHRDGSCTTVLEYLEAKITWT